MCSDLYNTVFSMIAEIVLGRISNHLVVKWSKFEDSYWKRRYNFLPPGKRTTSKYNTVP